MKRFKVLLTIIIVLSILLPTTVFAEDTLLRIEEEWLSVSGELALTNFNSEISELKGTTINLISLDTLFPDENGQPSEYKIAADLINAVTVLNSTTIELNMEESTFCDIQIYKLIPRDNDYTYFYRSPIPLASGTMEETERIPIYQPGATFNILEEGDYIVDFTLADDAAIMSNYAFVRVVNEAEAESPVKEEEATATPTKSKVLVNGLDKSFDAYNINGNNYFKLRDLAHIVNGTDKQFNVLWDGTKNAINLVSTTPYSSVGGEMSIGDESTKSATLSTSVIYKDGEEVSLIAYNINNNNYFKLRDIAQAFNIGITWDGTTSTIGIDTYIDYVAE